MGIGAIGEARGWGLRIRRQRCSREYLAVGLRVALHPQAEPRDRARAGPGSAGTFGEDAELAGRLTAAYIRGLRGGDELGPESVASMVKHFPGGGPQLDGEDPHFTYGREQVYPGEHFDYRLRPLSTRSRPA